MAAAAAGAVVRAAGRHLSGDGEHNGVVDGVHQVVDGSLRLIQFNKGGISRYLCVQLINPLLDLPYKIGIVIPVPCYLLDSLALNLVLGQHAAQIFVLLVCLLRPVHTDKARIFLERLAKHHRHFKHIGRVKANALGFLDMQKLNAEAERWHSFQADVERQFLRPEKSDLKWQ